LAKGINSIRSETVFTDDASLIWVGIPFNIISPAWPLTSCPAGQSDVHKEWLKKIYMTYESTMHVYNQKKIEITKLPVKQSSHCGKIYGKTLY